MKTKITTILACLAASVFAFAEGPQEPPAAPAAPENAPMRTVRPRISPEMREAFVQRMLLSLDDAQLDDLAKRIAAIQDMTPEEKVSAKEALPRPEFRRPDGKKPKFDGKRPDGKKPKAWKRPDGPRDDRFGGPRPEGPRHFRHYRHGGPRGYHCPPPAPRHGMRGHGGHCSWNGNGAPLPPPPPPAEKDSAPEAVPAAE